MLARELTLAEIGEIAGEVPEVELELFIHGAMCMAYSGRCYLSAFRNRRSSNQGDYLYLPLGVPIAESTGLTPASWRRTIITVTC